MSDEVETIDSLIRAVAAIPAVQRPLRVGERLGGRYLIEAVIGQGGMGTVYRALDEKLGETVALKVMRATLDPQLLRDEVRLAQKVTHPNVCRTFDLEDIDGYHLVKMELVAGETLAARLRREPALPVDACVDIARAIAGGLGAAHARKIVHGDLKPHNVMLEGDRVVLMDFGIAWLAAQPVDGVRGTIGYMAPELVRDGKADERADIYALGCVLYEMLAGEQVFRGQSAVVIAARHASELAPDVRSKRPNTPRWLARAVARMLAKRPDERPAGLAQLLAGPRSSAGVIAPVAMVALLAAVAGWWLLRSPAWVARVRDFDRFQENCDPPSFSPDGRWIVFSSDRRARNDYHAYVMSASGDDTFAIAPERIVSDARFTRDGKALLYDDWRGTNHVYRQPVDGPPWHETGPLEDLGSGFFLDDCGDALLMDYDDSTNGHVGLRFADGKSRHLFDTGPGERISSARCDPTGERIIIVAGAGHSRQNDVYLVNRDGKVKQLTHDHVAQSAVFAADGRTLVVSRIAEDQEHRLQLFEMDLDGNVLRQLLVDGGPDLVSDVSRDGRYLSFTRDDNSNSPVLVSASETDYLTRTRDTFWMAREVRPNLVVAERGRPSGYDVVEFDVETGVMKVLTPGRAPFPSMDGQTIYFMREGDPTRLYAIAASGGTAKPVADLPGHIQYGNAGPDGLHLTINLASGEVDAYRVGATGSIEREGVNGLVSAAARGGWRAVTAYAKRQGHDIELYLVPPGASLDDHAWRITVGSIHNRWLDDHRISYCIRDHCEILDVTTKDVVSLPIAQASDRNVTAPDAATVTLDGKRVLTEVFDSRVTRHVITNFDQR